MAKLPGIVGEVADALGMAAAVRLAARLGGTRLSIPRNFAPGTLLGDLVGDATAQWLVEHYGGDVVTVPILRAEISRLRREAIWQLAEEGRSRREIARILGCTQRWVAMVLAQERLRPAAEETPDLF